MDSSGDCALIYFVSPEEHLAEQYLPSTAFLFPAEGVSVSAEQLCGSEVVGWAGTVGKRCIPMKDQFLPQCCSRRTSNLSHCRQQRITFKVSAVKLDFF